MRKWSGVKRPLGVPPGETIPMTSYTRNAMLR